MEIRSFVKVRWITAICMNLLIISSAFAGELFIDPASPLVAVGETITLNVTNASGDVRWFAFDGQIQGEECSVKYLAPDRVTIDSVMAHDSAGNSGKVDVAVMEKPDYDEIFSRKNANWKLYI
ncbi:MAG: hypothetical protein U9N81_13840 [Bacillota bacterium]|nr:hypothetical protein [Bacillota bacterium]